MKNITWKNTLHDSVRGGGSISDLAHICEKLGYPYMCWNDRIYAVTASTASTGNTKWLTWNYTDITIDQVDANSKPHTGIVAVACRDSRR